MRRTIHRLPGHTHVGGFTLVELMITIVIVAVLLTIAVPNMRDFIWNNRLTSAANDLLRSYQLARTEAIKRQRNVLVCATTTPGSSTAVCSGGTFATGWMVFEDTNADGQKTSTEPLIESHPALDSAVIVRTNTANLTGFNSAGILAPGLVSTQNITICDQRGTAQIGTNSVAHAMLITPTGRARLSRTYNDVTSSVACP